MSSIVLEPLWLALSALLLAGPTSLDPTCAALNQMQPRDAVSVAMTLAAGYDYGYGMALRDIRVGVSYTGPHYTIGTLGTGLLKVCQSQPKLTLIQAMIEAHREVVVKNLDFE